MKRVMLTLVLGLSATCWAVGGNMGGGTGSEGNPYLIEDLADFDAFAGNSGYWAAGVHTKLMTDIDLAGRTYTRAVIAPDTDNSTSNFQGTSFSGIFDGSGHTISHLTITAPTKDYIGLFGRLLYYSNGQIKNLGVINVNVQGRFCVGGLCGENWGTISSCYVTGTVNGTGNGVGGLVGNSPSSSSITFCYATGAISGTGNSVGGLMGINSGSISSCYATGAVNGTGNYVGGLVGWNLSGTMMNCYSTGTAGGNSYVGGLIGRNYQGRVIYSYSTGRPTGTSWVGGLCGYAQTGGNYQDAGNFWDTETSETTASTMGTGKTTAQMKTLATFTAAGWDFSISDGDPADWCLMVDSYPQLGWQFSTSVPDVTGLSYTEAESALFAAEFVVGAIISEFSDSVPAGSVISQSPAAGTEAAVGSAVNLTISLGYYYTGGSGMTEDPYQIADANGFLQLSATPADWNKSFILTANIDLAGLIFTQAPIAPDTNISDSFQGTPFTGVFDGDGHTISNLAIPAPDNYYIGLFGKIESGGQIKNLGVINSNVQGRDYVGGLVGYNNSNGTISSCYATVIVSAHSYVGGLVGHNYEGTISSCYATGMVSGTGNYVGGLAGEQIFGTIANCYSTGTADGSFAVGGLVGYNYQGKVIHSYSAGKPTGTSSVGGLCGFAQTGGSYQSTGNFWDKETSQTTTSAMGMGKTTVEMKTLSTFTAAGWDLSDYDSDPADWCMMIDSYPQLRWQVPAITSIPDLTGLPQAQAESELTSAGLIVGSVTNRPHSSVPDGSIISQSPAAGISVGIGFAVDLVVSLGSYYTGGSGIAEDPYQIADVNGFLQLSAALEDWDKCFILAADIDLSGLMFTQAPIAPDTSASGNFQGTPFTGVFDGDGHTISNLTITAPDNFYIGLFGYTESGGQVKNLGILSIDVQGSYCVSGLMGFNFGTIISCYATGTISGNEIVGGLAGINGGTISFCHATGAVNGSDAGGLCGRNNGPVISCYSASDVYGTTSVGGLIGYNDGDVSSCYAEGSVTGNSYVGGLVGTNGRAGCTISSSYSTSDVTGNSYVGGLAGSNLSTISSCFWDVEVSGIDVSAGGTGKTTAEMMTQSTFTGWDFSDTDGDGADWMMLREGEDYPRLAWQAVFEGDVAGLYGVDMMDFAYLSNYWGLNDCAGVDECGRADIDVSGDVGIGDLAGVADDWMKGI